MSHRDLYQILGVSRNATEGEIKKAYRRLAREYHPDRNPSPQAEERFKEVSAAFAVLGDAQKKSAYDEFGADGLRDGFDADAARSYQQWAGRFGQGMGGGFGQGSGGFGGFGDFEDILGSLFGGGGGFGGRPQRRGRNIEQTVTISLRDALAGTAIELPRYGVTVRVPAGVADGQKMRLAGKGEQAAGGAGDLYAVINIAEPTGFRRDGADLSLDVPITVLQAITGGRIEVLTPEGGQVRLSIPKHCQSGQRLRLRGKGMTKKGGRGNLYVHIQIQVPHADDPACIAAAEALEQFYAVGAGDEPASES